MRPAPGSYPAYYETYIPLVKEDSVISALQKNQEEIRQTLSKIPAEKENAVYAPGKWSVKQVIQHFIDTERVIAYRALRFARKDPEQPLPFDENGYAEAAMVSHRNVKDLLEEFETVRNATLSLFRTFSDKTLLQVGNTHYGETTVLALGYLIAGHALHHLNVLKQRYL